MPGDQLVYLGRHYDSHFPQWQRFMILGKIKAGGSTNKEARAFGHIFRVKRKMLAYGTELLNVQNVDGLHNSN